MVFLGTIPGYHEDRFFHLWIKNPKAKRLTRVSTPFVKKLHEESGGIKS